MSIIIVIGGGPAGVMAAGIAASHGAKVYLIEKNGRIGKKLRITGKGRCNLTNACDTSELIKNVPVNGSFLYSAFNRFSNTMLIDFIEGLGVKTKVERGMRVFPESDSAIDVIEALKRFLKTNAVKLLTGEAESIITENNAVTGVKLHDGRAIMADGVVLATGGMSYPQTGSTGDGYKMAREIGHTIITPKPSLVPIVCDEKWIEDLMGLSLKNIGFKILGENDKLIYSDFGEMIFTHYGISGPVVLSASSHMRENIKYKVVIDLKPALSLDETDKRLIRDLEKFNKKDFINSLDDLLPKSLINTIARLSGIDFHKKSGQISKAERLTLASLLKGFTLTVKGFRPIEEAIITSGGVKTSEINPKTMESKLVKGLHFAGEIIDVDAYTGGFNLQIAFSTGYLAGDNIKLRSEIDE